MSLLTLVKDVCYEVGIAPPSTVINNEDDDALRLLAMFNTEGKRLMRRYAWQELLTEGSFTTVATEDQGVLATITGADDIDRIISDTVWNRDTQREQELEASAGWQANAARGTTGLRFNFRLRGNHILINPSPTAGQEVFFEYVSSAWVEAEDGTRKGAFTADSDSTVLDEDILKLGVKWRFRAAIGADFAADIQEYKEQLMLRFGADTPKKTIHMGSSGLRDKIGVVIARAV